MGDIKIGNSSITLKLGSSAVTAAYLGSTLVYSGGTPPTPSYKWLATYSDSHTESAACDSSSAITNGEITLTNLVSVEIGDCVTRIGSNAFYQCTSLASINIPDSVTTIDTHAFAWCTSLTSIIIPDSVTSIGSNVIDSSGVKSMTVGSGVTYLGFCAFCNNELTESFTITAPNPPTIENCDWIFATQCPIYVPSGSVSAYQNDQCWSAYAAGIIPIPTPTLQWVTFSNGDTIPSDLQIYGIKGIVDDLSKAFVGFNDDIYVEDETHNMFGVHIGGYYGGCYSETGIASNTSVEYTFSNIGCSDSYTVSSKTIANMSNDIQLLIYQ